MDPNKNEAGGKELRQLIAQLRPQLHAGTYVFATVAELKEPLLGAAIATFREEEGVTVVLARTAAEDLGLRYDYEAAWITLRVHSALQAVGLTAAVATELATRGISCNVMAGYHHDHLFVDAHRGREATAALRRLSEREGKG